MVLIFNNLTKKKTKKTIVYELLVKACVKVDENFMLCVFWLSPFGAMWSYNVDGYNKKNMERNLKKLKTSCCFFLLYISIVFKPGQRTVWF